jgi:hypothetical protein
MIAGTALGLLNANNNGNGLLGGLFGNTMNPAAAGVLMEKDAKIAKLEAEQYSDRAALEQSDRLLKNYLKPYGDAIVSNQTALATQAAEIACLQKTQALELKLMAKEVELAKHEAKCCCEKNQIAIATMGRVLDGITKIVVPNTSVCPGWGNVTITAGTTTPTA